MINLITGQVIAPESFITGGVVIIPLFITFILIFFYGTKSKAKGIAFFVKCLGVALFVGAILGATVTSEYWTYTPWAMGFILIALLTEIIEIL